MNKKAIFFDIDGTVFEHDIQDLPKSTYIALKILKEKGVKLCACTSRVSAELSNLSGEFIRMCDGFIHSAGAVIEINGLKYKTSFLDKDDVRAILKYCKENKIVARWAADDCDSCHFDSFMDDKITDIWRYLYNMEPTYKPWDGRMIVHIDTFPPMYKADEIRKLVNNTNVVVLKETIEFIEKDASKGNAIKEVMKHWSVDFSDAIAVGDGKNDIEMFRNVELSIAMGQSQDEVKNAASYVTDRIEEDGFYLALVKLGIIDDVLSML